MKQKNLSCILLAACLTLLSVLIYKSAIPEAALIIIVMVTSLFLFFLYSLPNVKEKLLVYGDKNRFIISKINFLLVFLVFIILSMSSDVLNPKFFSLIGIIISLTTLSFYFFNIKISSLRKMK